VAICWCKTLPNQIKEDRMREADLYPDLKAYLQAQGYEVKAEIGACDIMAIRGQEPPIVVEMKLSFTLGLVMQGVARQGLFDLVYLAVPVQPKGWALRYRDIVALCRRLGLGLLAVTPGQGVEAHLDPAPYQPRKNKVKAARLLREFERRAGDPNIAGTTGIKRVTAYRQDALRCVLALAQGATKASVVAQASGVSRAAPLMRDNHYEWFEKTQRGVYALSEQGRAVLAAHLGTLTAPPGTLNAHSGTQQDNQSPPFGNNTTKDTAF
jgi:hypothetical protein